MATAVPEIATGTTIAFSSSFLAKALNFSWSGMSRPVIDTAHLLTTAGVRPQMPGDLYDPGSMTADIQFLATATPPITGSAEAITFTFPGGVGSTMSASGFMTGFSFTGALEEVMTATVEIEFSGAIS